MAPAFVPERADVVWLTFDPQAGHEQAGHEQAGRRPAVVVSPGKYNQKVGLALTLPHGRGRQVVNSPDRGLRCRKGRNGRKIASWTGSTNCVRP